MESVEGRIEGRGKDREDGECGGRIEGREEEREDGECRQDRGREDGECGGEDRGEGGREGGWKVWGG